MAVTKSPWLWLLAGMVAGGGTAAVIARGGWPWANHDRIGDFRSRLSPENTATVLRAIGGERGIAVRRAKFIGYHLTNQGDDDPTTIELRRFWQRVAARTNGQLNMTVLTRDADLAGADNEGILLAAVGRVDAITANAPAFGNVIPTVAPIMTLLFSFNSSKEGLALVSNPIFQTVLEESGKPFNLRFLPGATLDSGMRVTTTKANRTIATTADLNGFRLRIPPSTQMLDQFKSLNVKPTILPVNALLKALRNGTVDGQENPPSFIASFNIDKVDDRIVLTNHLWSGFLTAINSKTWNAWPKEWQQIVLSETATLQARQWAAQEEANSTVINQAPQRFGMAVIRPDLSAVNRNPRFRAARERIVQQLDARLQPIARQVINGDLSTRLPNSKAD
jgi:TRAP-type C4-dicarboxylate transport system substrate-binding protein